MSDISLKSYTKSKPYIDESAISFLDNMKFEWIRFHALEPNIQDLMKLNDYFKNNAQIYLRGIKTEWLKYLPDVQMLNFSELIPENIELIKDRKIVGLKFEYEPDNKTDFSSVLYFQETLEELHITGNYNNIEETVRRLTNLRKLAMTSVHLNNLAFMEKLNISDFYYYGSRINDWSDLANVSTIRKFILKANTNLENLDFITHWTELEELELWHCSGLQHFPDINHLKKLKKVLLYNCSKLSDIEELKKLRNVYIRVNGKVMQNRYYEAN